MARYDKLASSDGPASLLPEATLHPKQGAIMAFIYNDDAAEDKERGIIIKKNWGKPEEELSVPVVYTGRFIIKFKYYLKTQNKLMMYSSGEHPTPVLVSCVVPRELVISGLEAAVQAAEGRLPTDAEVAEVLADIQEGVLLLATFGGRYLELTPDLKVAIEPGLMSWVTDRFGTHPAYHKDKINDALERNAVEVK